MEIRNIRHKGLKNFVEKNDANGLPADRVRRISQTVAFLLDMSDIDEFFNLRKWYAHVLSGDRDGVYSLMVSGNWRITFSYDAGDDEIYDLDFEDYH